MAEQNTLSIFQSDGSTPDKLAQAYTSITDQIQKAALSVQLKSQANQLTGNPKAGSVVVRRLQTSTVNTYGTARTAGEGDKISNNGVTVNLDTTKEIVEEVEQFDLNEYGLDGVITRRNSTFSLGMVSHLDTAFFAQAENDGTDATSAVSAGDTIADKLELLIQAVETTTNDNVDGVDRSMIAVTLLPSVYGQIRNYIDTLPNPNGGGVDVQTFHGARIYSNHRQTEEAIAMVVGSVAQPVDIIDFAVEKINLSSAKALEMFFKYGTESVMPDLIQYATLTEVSA